jgi:nucleotide-binding universal stress UspA family protein
MLKTDRILIASHDTIGARVAEEAALALCTNGASLLHLVVVPDLWRGMMGDDWLNNVSTRDVYCKHIESELGAEIDRHRIRLEPLAIARGASYRLSVALGKPAECLLEFAAQTNPDLVVIGSPRPPRSPGLRSRMQVEPLVKMLSAPLLIVPHPQ